MVPNSILEEQLRTILADPDKHGPILDMLLEVVKTSGSKGLKKHIEDWIDEIKQKEGVE